MPPPVPRVELVCEHCGARFKRMACELTRGRGKFCSRACLYASHRRVREVSCGRCGKRFSRKRSEIRTSEPFCSVACYRAAKAQGAHSYRKVGSRHEHRVVMERILGRPLGPKDIVHHVDGNPRNNDPGNLQLLTRAEHGRLHNTGRVRHSH